MSEQATRKTNNTYYSRSYANVDLGAFLIFFGVVGAVPLYGLFANIVLKQADIEWRLGIWLGIFFVLAGYLFIRCSRRRFQVKANPDGSGSISIKEGLFKSPLIYSYAPGSKIKLAVTNTEAGQQKSLLQITLVDGNCHYLLDSRKMNALHESRVIAEYLCRSTGLNLLVTQFDNLELTPADLDLTFKALHAKYPVLMGKAVERPSSCHVRITSLNDGHDRRYSWGFRSNGLLWQFISLCTLSMLLALLPVIDINQQLYSLFGWAIATENTVIFYEAAMVFFAILLIFAGFRETVTIEGFRINVLCTFWGIATKKRSLLIDNILDVFTKETAAANYIVLLDKDGFIKLRVANSVMAIFLCGDMRHFMEKR